LNKSNILTSRPEETFLFMRDETKQTIGRTEKDRMLIVKDVTWRLAIS